MISCPYCKATRNLVRTDAGSVKDLGPEIRDGVKNKVKDKNYTLIYCRDCKQYFNKAGQLWNEEQKFS
tara:strand:- start:163 stop:366 length:204 start_codon:yes stop_codon:yes gene_type:complete